MLLNTVLTNLITYYWGLTLYYSVIRINTNNGFLPFIYLTGSKRGTNIPKDRGLTGFQQAIRQDGA